jgi:hypothetical protein
MCTTGSPGINRMRMKLMVMIQKMIKTASTRRFPRLAKHK